MKKYTILLMTGLLPWTNCLMEIKAHDQTNDSPPNAQVYSETPFEEDDQTEIAPLSESVKQDRKAESSEEIMEQQQADEEENREIQNLIAHAENLLDQIGIRRDCAEQKAELDQKLIEIGDELEAHKNTYQSLAVQLEELETDTPAEAKEAENEIQTQQTDAEDLDRFLETGTEQKSPEEGDFSLAMNSPQKGEEMIHDPDGQNEKISELKARMDEETSAIAQLEQEQARLEEKRSLLEADSAAEWMSDESGTEEISAVSVQMPGNTPNLHLLKRELTDLEVQVSLGNITEQIEARIREISAILSSMETVAVYRLYNPNSSEHFYTPSEHEKDYLSQIGWSYEGIGWRSPKNDTSQPVYRVYNPNAGDHHYTTNAQERDHLVNVGWNDEGVAWYSDPYVGVQILRAYNPNAKGAGAHHFTDNEIERDLLVDLGWRQENVAFYARFMYSICEESDGANSRTIWYDMNDQPLSGEYRIGGWWHAYDSAGSPITGFYGLPFADMRYYDADGRHARGVRNIDGAWYDFDDTSGYPARSKLKEYTDGTLRYYQSDGKAATGAFNVANASFNADGTGNILTTRLNGVPLYMQNDLAWAGVLINGSAFGSTGCVPTVLASVINAATGVQVSPLDLGREFGRLGYLNTDVPGTKAIAMPYTASQYGMTMSASLSRGEAARILRAGGVLAAAVGPGAFCPAGATHELLVMGYDNGNVFIHDPLGFGTDGWYSLSLIFDQQSQDPDDRSHGGPIFGFYNRRIPS